MAKNKNDNLIVRYDAGSDALSLVLKLGRESAFKEIAPGVNIEFDARGKVLGFEILNASKRLKPVFQPLKMVMSGPRAVAVPN
jgi:uncharacterized protein YuzE